MRREACRWRPAGLTEPDITLLTKVLGVIAVVRGLDYLIGADEASATLTAVEAAAPLWLWGTVLVAGGVHLLAGAGLRAHFAVWVGHALLCVVNLGLFVAFTQTALTMGLDGIRSAAIVGALLYVHAVLALRTGTQPVGVREGRPVAVVLEADGGP